MVVRGKWNDSLNRCEPLVLDRAGRLVESQDRPGDVRDLARRLGARIASLSPDSSAEGLLRRNRQDDCWQVEIKGDISGQLDSEQQFSVAHELAHIMFKNARIGPGPSSEEEYWMLEEACDRVARRLLSIEDQD